MLRKTIGILLTVAGLLLFFSPELLTKSQEVQVEHYVKDFEEENKGKDRKTDVRYEKGIAYNREIYENGQKDFKDAWICTQDPVKLKGLKGGKFGYIKIPAMDVKLPLYLGASKEHMSKGAAILGGTSLPIGGDNTNSVIAGHRGYGGKPFFREIEKLKVGDKVYVKNPWETLVYTVEKIKVIDPYDTESVKIQEGRDLLTLITCHPYRSHGKNRYLVYCTRKADKPAEEAEETPVLIKSSQPEIRKEQNFRKTCGGALFLLCLVAGVRKGRRLLMRKRRAEGLQ